MFRPLPFFIGLRYTRAKASKSLYLLYLRDFDGRTDTRSVSPDYCDVGDEWFDREMKERVLGMVPHATITAAGSGLHDWRKLVQTIPEREGVDAAAPFVEAQGMLTRNGEVRGAMVYGIEPSMEQNVSILPQHMSKGEATDLQPGEYGILLGEILANALGASLGDKVTLVLPEANVNLVGVLPRLKRFTVTGIFSVGADVDGSMAYAHRADLAKFLRVPEGATGIRLKMTDLFEAPRLAWDIAVNMPGRYYVQKIGQEPMVVYFKPFKWKKPWWGYC